MSAAAAAPGVPMLPAAPLASSAKHSDLAAHTRRFRKLDVSRGKAVFSSASVSVYRKVCSSLPPRASLVQKEAL